MTSAISSKTNKKMYATRPLQEFGANPEAVLQPPPEGPGSGYLTVNERDPDDEAGTCCWGCCCGPMVRDLPIPQNTILTVKYSRQEGENRHYYTEKVLFVPVINLPLSANRYYVVVAKGKRKGQVYTCSKEEDMTPCCFCQCIQDVKPKPFDHRDIYQQIEIIPHKGRFTAKAVASDGFPPWIFRQKYWTLHENKENYQLAEALGIDKKARNKYQEINTAESVIAGKWYCPFIFFREGNALKDQMQRSMFYEVTLEQSWEKVYSGTEKKRVLFQGKETMREDRELRDSFVWFTKVGALSGERTGLSLALWERVKWEENTRGWNEGAGTMVEEVKFDSSVLVERFCFRRLDGSVALALDFIHTDKVRQ